MTLRWVFLAAFTGISLIYGVMGRNPRRDSMGNHGVPIMVWIYLLATLASVALAQNHVYSGLRWVTHAMLIVTFMILLRGTIYSRCANQFIWILKGIVLLLLVISFLMPAPHRVYDNPYFRGAMGDSNSLGHVAMIGILIFTHGAIVSRKFQWRILQVSLALGATGILFFSWARSSVAAFLVGLVLLNYFYGLTRSFLAKSFVILLVCFLLASPMIQSGILHFVAKNREAREKEKPSHFLGIIQNDFFEKSPSFETVIRNRSLLWLEAWEGFKKRPFLGWGFGANQDIRMEWSIRPTSIGLVRDVTNDILFILEGSGIIGFFAYIGLMISIFKQSLSRQQIIRIRKNSKQSLTRGNTHVPKCSLPRDDQQAIFYILSVTLVALFMTDGSAFSAGSLISAIFWISASAAGALRAEAVVSERRMNLVKQETPKPVGMKLRLRNPKWESRTYNEYPLPNTQRPIPIPFARITDNI